MPPVAEDARPRRRNRPRRERERTSYDYDYDALEAEFDAFDLEAEFDAFAAESEPTDAPEEDPPLFGGAGVMGHLREIPAGIARGFARVAAAPLKTAALAMPRPEGEDPREAALYRAGQSMEDSTREATGGDPDPKARFGSSLGEGIGSVLGIVPAGIAAAYAAPGVVGAGVVAAGLGLATGAVEQYEEARAHGADDNEARIAAGLGGAVGAITEPLGLGGGRFLKTLAGGAVRKIAVAGAREGGEEFIQEGVQAGAGNLIADALYDPGRPVTQGVGEAALMGGLVGAGFGGGGAAVGRGRAAKAAALREAGLGAPEVVLGPAGPAVPDGTVVGRGTVEVAGEAAPPVEVPVAGKEAALVEAGVRPRPSQPDLASVTGKGQILGNPNVAPEAPTAPLVEADDPNAAPSVPAPESPIGRVAAETRKFRTDEVMRLQKALGGIARGFTVEEDVKEFRVRAPNGRTLHIVGANEIRPEALPGGPEMLQRELEQNRGLKVGGEEFTPGAPRGLFFQNPSAIRLRTDDGQEFTANDVIVLSSTADATTIPFELYRWGRANILTTAERRLMQREFPTEEAEAAAYVELVNGRLDHPFLSRIREFFQRLAEFFGAGKPGARGRALMRDLAGGRLGAARKGTLAAEDPDFGVVRGYRVGSAEAGDPGGTNAAIRAAEKKRADAREATKAPLDAPSRQNPGGLVPVQTAGEARAAGVAPVPFEPLRAKQRGPTAIARAEEAAAQMPAQKPYPFAGESDAERMIARMTPEEREAAAARVEESEAKTKAARAAMEAARRAQNAGPLPKGKPLPAEGFAQGAFERDRDARAAGKPVVPFEPLSPISKTAPSAPTLAGMPSLNDAMLDEKFRKDEERAKQGRAKRMGKVKATRAVAVPDAVEKVSSKAIAKIPAPPVQEVAVASIKTDPARFQFKGQTEEGGVDPKKRLSGKTSGHGKAPLMLWEDRSGQLFVVNGHHRLDLFQRNNDPTTTAQVYREKDGVTAPMARALGAEANILDETGSVYDYARYFQQVNITREDARERGLLRSEKNKGPGYRGFVLGRFAGPDLYGQYINGGIDEATAFAIAESATTTITRKGKQVEVPDLRRQFAAIDYVLASYEGKRADRVRPDQAKAFVQSLSKTSGEEASRYQLIGQSDFLPYDDDALVEGRAMAQKVSELRRMLDDKITPASGVVRKSEGAASVGIKSESGLDKTLEGLRQQRALLDEDWHTRADVVAEVRRLAGLPPLEAPVSEMSQIEGVPDEEPPQQEGFGFQPAKREDRFAFMPARAPRETPIPEYLPGEKRVRSIGFWRGELGVSREEGERPAKGENNPYFRPASQVYADRVMRRRDKEMNKPLRPARRTAAEEEEYLLAEDERLYGDAMARAREEINREAEESRPRPAEKKDVFRSRQVSVPEMPKGPRPVVQKMFGLDLQPPAVATGENPDADPDTPDMFTGETGAKKPAKAKPKGRAPGGQGSFGFQPASRPDNRLAYMMRKGDSERYAAIASFLDESFPDADPVRIRGAAAAIEAAEDAHGNPMAVESAIQRMANVILSHKGTDKSWWDYADSASDVLSDAFDISPPSRSDWDWVATDDSSRRAVVDDDVIHLSGVMDRNEWAATVRPVAPADFDEESVLFSSERHFPHAPKDELLEEIRTAYAMAADRSEAIWGAIILHTKQNHVAFQPGKDERVPPLVARNVPDARAAWENREKTGRNPVRADADVLAEAEAMAADPAAVGTMLASAAKAKRPLTDAETVAAEIVGRRASVRSFFAGVGSEEMTRAFDIWEDFLTTRSASGRALRSGQIITHRLLSEADKVRADVLRIIFGPGADGRTVPPEKREAYIREATAEAAAQGIDLESFMTSNAAVEAMDAARDRFDALLRAEGAEYNTSSGRDFRVRKTINEAKKAADQIRADLVEAAGVPGRVARAVAKGKAKLRAIFKGKFQPAAGTIDALFASSAELSKASIANRKTGAKLARIFQAKRATGWDALHEFWISGILSGPQTQIVNFASNTLEQMFSAGMRVPQAILADMARLLRVHDKGGPSIGELPEFYKGLLPGIALGWKNMLETFESEMPVLSSSDFARPFAISGKKGKHIRTFVRALAAADQFFKGIAWRMQVGAEAWRAGWKKGLRGLDLRAFIDDQIAKPDPEILVDALAYADETTFNQDAGPLAEAAAFVRRKLHLRYQLPFINIAVNLLQTGVRRTPLGTAKVAAGLAKEAIAKRAGGDFRYEDKFRDMAEQFVAWGALVALAGAMGDDDDPRITGTKLYGVDKKGDIELAYRAAPPQSIKIGDRWYSYARLDPFASSLALMVDGLRTMRAGGKDAMEKAIRSAVGLVTDKTFLDQLGDLFEVATEPSAKNVGQFASKFATSWVPNIIRQPARAFEPNILETKDQPLGARMKRDAFPAVRGPFVPKVDLWGREIDASPSPKTDLLYRILSPSRAQRAEEGTELALDRTIMRHNALFPDNAWAPESPVSKFDRGGVPYQMTPAEYNTFMRIAGTRTVRALRGLAARPLPKDDDARGWAARIGAMKDVIERERSVAKDIFVRARRSGRPYQVPGEGR